MKNLKLIIVLLFYMFFSFYSCEKGDDNMTQFNLRLTDAPADYDAVNIDIESIAVHYSNSDEDSWEILENVNTGIYDLLLFRNGLDALLVTEYLPEGELNEIRLILGENNSVVKDGISHELKTPSAQTSGLKLKIDADLVSGLTYNLWIDFDAERSIVETGNGKFNLKPVIRAYSETTSGKIKGFVSPAESLPYVMIIANQDTIGTKANSDGYFMLGGIPRGTYNVEFYPVGTFNDKIIDYVVVDNNIIDLGTVVLSE